MNVGDLPENHGLKIKFPTCFAGASARRARKKENSVYTNLAIFRHQMDLSAARCNIGTMDAVG